MFRRVTLQSFTGLLLVSGLVGMVVTTPAGADEVEAAAAGGGRHCAALLESLQPGEKVSQRTDLGCFETYAEVIAAVTEGAVQLPKNVAPDEVPDQDIVPFATIIGRDYDLTFYRGGTFTWLTNNPSGCFGGSIYAASYVGSALVFNNRASSTRAFSGCGRNFSYTGFFQTGFVEICFPNCPVLRLSNLISSKKWTR